MRKRVENGQLLVSTPTKTTGVANVTEARPNRGRLAAPGAPSRRQPLPPLPGVTTLTESSLTVDDAHPVDL
jgi:hypothetical protein